MFRHLSILICFLASALVVTLPGCKVEELKVGFVIKDPRDVPPPITRTTPETVHIDLVAKEVAGEIAPGKSFAFWTFNGTVPGPMIRVMEGDLIEIRLHNDLGNVEPHDIDFHAVTGPGGGAPVLTVKPGETKTVSFRALRRGAYFYHCAAEGMPWEHVAHGMYGLIQVEPPGGLPGGYKEFYVGQSEWYLTADLAEAEAEEEEEEEGSGPQPEFTVDMAKAARGLPDLYTFNGHTEALMNPQLFGDAMRVNQGDKVRIFFANSGPNVASSFHIMGVIFDQVYPGDPADVIHNEEVLFVSPGSAAVAESTMPVPGDFMLVDHALFHASLGAMGKLSVMPTVAPTDADPNGSWPTDIYGEPAWESEPHDM